MSDRITISDQYPAHWAFRGRPVLLLGGSVEDNLFQIGDLEAHLQLLHDCGGNYVRSTMSSRDEGDVWPFERDGELYDLNQPSAEFWRRFANFLDLTRQWNIIVQIEVWATFDFYRDNWDVNPFNPKNNHNYNAEETGLPQVVSTHPTRTENNFFWSVPATNNNTLVLRYQQQFVDTLLEHTLPQPHVLYCMDNETSVTDKWGAYWANYIKEKAAEAGVTVHTTEMWDPHDLAHEMHNATFDHPEIYSFVDISQNNHQVGQAHWDNAQKQRQRIANQVRPLNNVKIYGADTGRYGTTRDGIERFWRNIFGKLASARFHRPDSGIGLSPIAQANIRSGRMFTDAFNNFFAGEPQMTHLSERAENLAYCFGRPATELGVFFTIPGSVVLDTSRLGRNLRLRWLDIPQSTWAETQTLTNPGQLRLQAPFAAHQAVLIQNA